MLRIDINSGGLISVRELGQPRLGNSMTVMEVRGQAIADKLIVHCCRLCYDDAAITDLYLEAEGRDTQQAKGYSGYLFPLPEGLPADDQLAVVQEAFHKAQKLYQ